MRKLTIAATAALITCTATAQQPLQCLNPDILNGVVFMGNSELKMDVTRALPTFMSGFRTPIDFNLIGTGVRGLITYVAFKTPLSSDKAYAATLTALGTEGWEVESQPGSTQTFLVANGPRTGSVCRSGERRILLIWDAGGASYVDIVNYPQARKRNCNEPDTSSNMALGRGGLLPRFQFPAGTSLAQGGGGGGGSNDMYTTSSRIISPETPAKLVEHLAGQMQGQGWHPDTDWSGVVSTGSNWRKIIDGQLTWATLEIIRVSEGTYDVDITLMQSQ